MTKVPSQEPTFLYSIGERLATVESRDVKFLEDIMVSDVELLKVGNPGLFVPYEPLLKACDLEMSPVQVAGWEINHL